LSTFFHKGVEGKGIVRHETMLSASWYFYESPPGC